MQIHTLSAVNRVSRKLTVEQFKSQYPYPFLIHENTQSTIDCEGNQTMGMAYMPTSIDPREARSWVVYVVRGPEGRPCTVSLGRADDNDIIITDPSVSKNHARLSVQEGESTLRVVDLGSTNGTFLNDERLESNKSFEVPAGQCVDFGRVPLRFLGAEGLYDYLDSLREDGKL